MFRCPGRRLWRVTLDFGDSRLWWVTKQGRAPASLVCFCRSAHSGTSMCFGVFALRFSATAALSATLLGCWGCGSCGSRCEVQTAACRRLPWLQRAVASLSRRRVLRRTEYWVGTLLAGRVFPPTSRRVTNRTTATDTAAHAVR